MSIVKNMSKLVKLFAAFKTAAAAAAMTALSAAAAHAANDVYVGSIVTLVGEENPEERPVVVFAFDDAAAQGFTAIDTIGIYVDPAYKRAEGEPFKPREACVYTLDFPSEVTPAYESAPVYGPSSGQKTVNYPDMPTFFAQKAMQMLISRGEVEQESATFANYGSCVGFVWSTLLSQSGEFWQSLLEERGLAQ